MNNPASAGKGILTMDTDSNTWVLDCQGHYGIYLPAITDATDTIWLWNLSILVRVRVIATNYQLRDIGVYQATDVDYLQNERTVTADNMWNALCHRTWIYIER